MAPKTVAAPLSSEVSDKSIQYIMLVLSTCEAFKPNYHAVATEAGICDANTAQKKFKKFVEQAGYSLVKGAVIGPNGSSSAATAAAAPKKATQESKKKTAQESKKKTADKRSKKRKVDALDDQDDGSEDGAE